MLDFGGVGRGLDQLIPYSNKQQQTFGQNLAEMWFWDILNAHHIDEQDKKKTILLPALSLPHLLLIVRKNKARYDLPLACPWDTSLSLSLSHFW